MRLFISIQFEQALVDALLCAQRLLEKRFHSELRLVPPDHLHLTLKFIGEADETDIALLELALEEVSAQFAPFTCTLGDFGAFPREAAPRVIWAHTKSDELVNLGHQVESAIVNAGFPPSVRPFSPHITLARVRDQTPPQTTRHIVPTLRELPRRDATSHVATLRMMQSILTPTGASHSLLRELPLNG